MAWEVGSLRRRRPHLCQMACLERFSHCHWEALLFFLLLTCGADDAAAASAVGSASVYDYIASVGSQDVSLSAVGLASDGVGDVEGASASSSAKSGEGGVAVTVAGLCEQANFKVPAFIWQAPGALGGDWVAKAAWDVNIALALGAMPGTANAGQQMLRCALTAVSVHAGDVSPELRLMFDSCDIGGVGGARAVLGGPLQRYSTGGSAEEDDGKRDGTSNLVRWMCQVSPLLCARAMYALKAPSIAVTTTQVATPPPSTIFLGREVAENIVGLGQCNTSGINFRQVPATNLKGCRLECVQRLAIKLATREESHLSKPCKGYAFNASANTCLLYDSSSTPIGDSDGAPGWTCYSLTSQESSYAHGFAATTSPAPMPTGLPRTHGLLDLSSLLGGHSDAGVAGWQGTATRLQMKSIRAGDYDPVDWYSVDGSLAVDTRDWDLLMEMLVLLSLGSSGNGSASARQATRAAANPAALRIGSVCVVGCDGLSMSVPCTPVKIDSTSSWKWILPWLLVTNVIAALVASYLTWNYCMKDQAADDKPKAIGQVVYFSGAPAENVYGIDGQATAMSVTGSRMMARHP